MGSYSGKGCHHNHDADAMFPIFIGWKRLVFAREMGSEFSIADIAYTLDVFEVRRIIILEDLEKLFISL